MAVVGNSVSPVISGSRQVLCCVRGDGNADAGDPGIQGSTNRWDPESAQVHVLPISHIMSSCKLVIRI